MPSFPSSAVSLLKEIPQSMIRLASEDETRLEFPLEPLAKLTKSTSARSIAKRSLKARRF